MSTKLEKSVSRESTAKVKDREILVTLTDKQEIELKLKGLKSGTLRIGIKELFELLGGGTDEKPRPGKSTKVPEGEPMISLTRLRALNAVTKSDVAVTAKLDSILAELIEDWRQENVPAETPKKKANPIPQQLELV